MLAARALFVFIGARPATSWLADAVTLDRRGFIPTGQDVVQVTADLWEPLARAPLAAGDRSAGSLRRRRRPQRLGQAGGLRGRRGRHGRPPGARAPRGGGTTRHPMTSAHPQRKKVK